jgi:inorganic pyrophosphatase
VASDFWQHVEKLVTSTHIEVDRPKGSSHPHYPDMIYPVDYGYLVGTVSADGGGIDIWVGSRSPRTVTGVICTIDLLQRDAEVKILLGCTEDEMQTIERFLNQGDMRCILKLRDESED